MARHKRPHNFSMQFDVPWQSRPLVKRRNRIPITERILPPDGRIEVALDEDEVRTAAELLKSREVGSVIVCFLFAFLNDAHELRAKEIVKEVMPDAYVGCSSEVVDVIREYERFSTAAMNAFIGPRTSYYLNNLATALMDNGVDAQIRVMQSNGGVTTLAGAAERPVTILMSGPAGGVIGGQWAGDMSGVRNLITVDIGGTSADISVVPDGEVRIMNPRDTQVGGYPILAPMIDLSTIGAGGGSIAYVDEGGAFRVGPRSAGAEPRAGLLRPGRHRAHRDRRPGGARPAGPRAVPGRWAGDRPGALAQGAGRQPVRAARHVSGGGCARRDPGHQLQHVARDPREFRGQGRRSARLTRSSPSAAPGRCTAWRSHARSSRAR